MGEKRFTIETNRVKIIFHENPTLLLVSRRCMCVCELGAESWAGHNHTWIKSELKWLVKCVYGSNVIGSFRNRMTLSLVIKRLTLKREVKGGEGRPMAHINRAIPKSSRRYEKIDTLPAVSWCDVEWSSHRMLFTWHHIFKIINATTRN